MLSEGSTFKGPPTETRCGHEKCHIQYKVEFFPQGQQLTALVV